MTEERRNIFKFSVLSALGSAAVVGGLFYFIDRPPTDVPQSGISNTNATVISVVPQSHNHYIWYVFAYDTKKNKYRVFKGTKSLASTTPSKFPFDTESFKAVVGNASSSFLPVDGDSITLYDQNNKPYTFNLDQSYLKDKQDVDYLNEAAQYMILNAWNEIGKQ